MTCGAKVAVLAYRRTSTDDHPGYTVTIDPVGQAACVAHAQIPWCPHPGRRVGVDVAPYLCAEYPQQESAPTMQKPGRGSIEQNPDEPPQGARNTVPVADLHGHEHLQMTLTQSGRVPPPSSQVYT